MLGGFRDWRLRTKFLAITVLVGLVPLAFYALFPFRQSFSRLREIESRFLQSKLGEVEALLHHGRIMVEAEAARLAALGIGRKESENGEGGAQWQMPEAGSLRSTAFVEKGFYLHPDGEFQALEGFPRENWDSGYDDFLHSAIQSTTLERKFTFFAAVGSELMLVACAPVGDIEKTDAESVPWIVLAVNLTRGLAPKLGDLIDSEVEFVVEEGADSKSAVAVEGGTIDSALCAVRPISTSSGQTGYLRVTMPPDLIGPLISNHFWSFLLFAASLYLSAIIGTTCAAAVVLKPLNRLIDLMGSVGGANTYRTRAPEDRSDEIGELALSFNRLMSRLQMAQRELVLVRKQEIEIERLEAIHAMVITVAHEVNNPLTFILGQAELMLMEEDLTPENKNSLEVIRDMSLRISSVIKQLQDLQRAEMTSYIDWQQMIKLEPEEESRVLSG